MSSPGFFRFSDRELVEVRARLDDGGHVLLGHVELTVLAVQADVEALAEGLAVGFRHAEQARDDLDGKVRGEVGDRVELGRVRRAARGS